MRGQRGLRASPPRRSTDSTLGAALSRADFEAAARRQMREGIGRRGADDEAVRIAAPELKPDLARAKVERYPPERFQDIGPEQQRRFVGKPEQLERRQVREG